MGMGDNTFSSARGSVHNFLSRNPGNFHFSTTIDDDALTLSFYPSTYSPTNVSESQGSSFPPSPSYSPVQWEYLPTRQDGHIISPGPRHIPLRLSDSLDKTDSPDLTTFPSLGNTQRREGSVFEEEEDELESDEENNNVVGESLSFFFVKTYPDNEFAMDIDLGESFFCPNGLLMPASSIAPTPNGTLATSAYPSTTTSIQNGTLSIVSSPTIFSNGDATHAKLFSQSVMPTQNAKLIPPPAMNMEEGGLSTSQGTFSSSSMAIGDGPDLNLSKVFSTSAQTNENIKPSSPSNTSSPPNLSNGDANIYISSSMFSASIPLNENTAHVTLPNASSPPAMSMGNATWAISTSPTSPSAPSAALSMEDTIPPVLSRAFSPSTRAENGTQPTLSNVLSLAAIPEREAFLSVTPSAFSPAVLTNESAVFSTLSNVPSPGTVMTHETTTHQTSSNMSPPAALSVEKENILQDTLTNVFSFPAIPSNTFSHPAMSIDNPNLFSFHTAVSPKLPMPTMQYGEDHYEESAERSSMKPQILEQAGYSLHDMPDDYGDVNMSDDPVSVQVESFPLADSSTSFSGTDEHKSVPATLLVRSSALGENNEPLNIYFVRLALNMSQLGEPLPPKYVPPTPPSLIEDFATSEDILDLEIP
ncbi:hypothetical protein F4604DRAFT_1933870 [Suillus subluteus]|nr:hypothetical protein F4604DRAFT_1933870 [Suillus subluteus]